MTRDERDARLADLERVGVRIIRTEPKPDHVGEWQVYAWCDNPAHAYWVTDGMLFREAVRAGLSGVLPKGALDHT